MTRPAPDGHTAEEVLPGPPREDPPASGRDYLPLARSVALHLGPVAVGYAHQRLIDAAARRRARHEAEGSGESDPQATEVAREPEPRPSPVQFRKWLRWRRERGQQIKEFRAKDPRTRQSKLFERAASVSQAVGGAVMAAGNAAVQGAPLAILFAIVTRRNPRAREAAANIAAQTRRHRVFERATTGLRMTGGYFAGRGWASARTAARVARERRS